MRIIKYSLIILMLLLIISVSFLFYTKSKVDKQKDLQSISLTLSKKIANVWQGESISLKNNEKIALSKDALMYTNSYVNGLKDNLDKDIVSIENIYHDRGLEPDNYGGYAPDFGYLKGEALKKAVTEYKKKMKELNNSMIPPNTSHQGDDPRIHHDPKTNDYYILAKDFDFTQGGTDIFQYRQQSIDFTQDEAPYSYNAAINSPINNFVYVSQNMGKLEDGTHYNGFLYQSALDAKRQLYIKIFNDGDKITKIQVFPPKDKVKQ